MSTASQKRANQQNAQHSTGPPTDEGKQRSSQNALKHGLRAKHPLIPGEDRDEFNRHNAELQRRLAPTDYLEETLVDQVVDITWRLKRVARIEAAVIDDHFDTAALQPMNRGQHVDKILGRALANDDKALAQLNRISRYEAQLSRRYQSVMKELRTMRKQRAQSALLKGLSAARADTKAIKPTQSTASLLESVRTLDPLPDPPNLDDHEFHQQHPANPSQPGNEEAAA